MRVRTIKMGMSSIAVFLLVLGLAGSTHAQQNQQQLDQLVQQLQNDSGNQQLRRQIIQLADTMTPRPAVPEEANRHFVRAGVFMQNAQSTSDYNTVIGEYAQALLLAPWWGNAYYNLSIVEEKAGRFDEATANLKLYLLTQPAAANAKDAQDKIYAIEVEKELAAKRNAAAQAAADQQKEEDDWKQLSTALAAANVQAALAGPWVRSGGHCADATVTIADGALKGSLSFKGSYTVSDPLGSRTHEQTVTAEINGSIANGAINGQADFPSTSMEACNTPPNEQTLSGTLSADGRSLALQTTHAMYGAQTKGMSIFQTCVSVDPAGSQTVQCTLVSTAPQPLPLLQIAQGLPPGSPQISQTAAARLVLSHGGDVNAADKFGMTALHYAAKQGNTEIAELLLENGAQVDPVDQNNDTPLSYAIDSNSLNTVQLLLDHGADVNAKNNSGATALLGAAETGNLDVAQFLVAHGADVNAKNNSGDTALILAASSDSGHPDVVQALLSHGADVNAKNNDGNTALMGAVETGNLDVAQFLVAHGADVNAKNNSGATALLGAAKTGNLDVVKLLIAHGADINAQDLKGHSALQYAKHGRNKDDRKAMIQFFEGQGLKK